MSVLAGAAVIGAGVDPIARGWIGALVVVVLVAVLAGVPVMAALVASRRA